MWIYHDLGVSQNSGTPKWMVKIMENPMNKWMIWVVFTPIFGSTHLPTFREFFLCPFQKWLVPSPSYLKNQQYLRLTPGT